MALMHFEDQKQIITLANEFDVCITCANKYAKENKVNLSYAKSKLEGRFTGQRVVKFTEITTTVICKECIAKFNEKLNPQQVETKIEEPTESAKPEKKEVAKNETKSTKTKK